MKGILPIINPASNTPLYMQIYEDIRKHILDGTVKGGERLPSLRSLASELELSITTIGLAYNQLEVEGYINSRPQSGYYVTEMTHFDAYSLMPDASPSMLFNETEMSLLNSAEDEYLHDISAFDFAKWKKCSNKIFNEFNNLLLFEGNPQGEEPLRKEISRYVYQSRGVVCGPNHVVIGAGTQQLTTQLSRLLNAISINHVAVENPGYLPVRNIFRDNGFSMTPVEVRDDGIAIDKLPSNIRSAVYVNPSNQFPTGAIMPVGRRYELLDWALKNDSIIIEDDYDSELRYFGKPVPALQGLDKNHRVIYLGSFSSTLFPAIKISYMILPDDLTAIFDRIKSDYTQTCSKAEQLTLALFMSRGMYQTGIKKLRNLNAHKLLVTNKAIHTYGEGLITARDTRSGLNLIIRIQTNKTPDQLCMEAKELGIHIVSMTSYHSDIDSDSQLLIFYYNRLPAERIEELVNKLCNVWLH